MREMSAAKTASLLYDEVATLREQNQKLREALLSLYTWYDRDGSVGGAANAFEDNRKTVECC